MLVYASFQAMYQTVNPQSKMNLKDVVSMNDGSMLKRVVASMQALSRRSVKVDIAAAVNKTDGKEAAEATDFSKIEKEQAILPSSASASLDHGAKRERARYQFNTCILPAPPCGKIIYYTNTLAY